MKKLTDLEVEEISLVDIGANKKKFLIFKSKTGSETMSLKNVIKSLRVNVKKNAEKEEEVKKAAEAKIAEEAAVKKAKEEDEVKKAADLKAEEDKKEAAKKAADPVTEAVVPVKKELSEGAAAALKAIGRILTPFKSEISDADVDGVLKEIGVEFPHKEETEKADGEGEDKEELKKLFAIPEDVKEEHAIEALNKAKDAMGEHLAKMGYKKEGDEAIEKEEPPKGDEEVHKIFKAHKDLVKKNADLEQVIANMKKGEVEREIVQKSLSFTHLGLKKEEVVEVLKAAREVSEKNYEVVCKQYSALNEQAKKGGLFSELGSNQAGNSGDIDAKIDAVVDSIVKKSAGKTKEQVYAEYIESEEGKKLYAERQNSRPNGI